MKYFKILLLSLFFVVAGCATKGNFKDKLSDDYTKRTSYTVMGLGGAPLGYGMKNLAPKIDADVYSRHKGSEIYNDIATKVRLGKLKRPLTLVGHSMGGGVVAKIAERLCKDGIKTDYMVIIDAPLHPKVSKCVGKVDQFVTTGGGIGKRLSRGSYIVIDDVSHVALGDHPKVHSRIIKVRRSL